MEKIKLTNQQWSLLNEHGSVIESAEGEKYAFMPYWFKINPKLKNGARILSFRELPDEIINLIEGSRGFPVRNPIDNVTTEILDAALRMCDISLKREVIDKIIDLVELIEEKGESISIQDVAVLQAEWKKLPI